MMFYIDILSDYNLKMSKMMIFYNSFVGNYNLKMSKIYLFLSCTNLAS